MKISEIARALVLVLTAALITLVPVGPASANTSVGIQVLREGMPFADTGILIWDVAGEGPPKDHFVLSDGGTASFSVPNGNYQIQFILFEAEELGTNQSRSSLAVFVAVDDANVTMVDSYGTSLTRDVNGNFPLVIPDSNVFGKVVDVTQTIFPLSRFDQASFFGDGSGSFISTYIERKVGNDWVTDYLSSGSVFSDGSFALAVTSSGTFRIKLEPTGIEGYATSVTEEFEIVSTTSPAVDLGVVTLGQGNVGGVVLNPDGSPAEFSLLVPIDESGRELWNLYSFTDGLGKWSMALEDGTFYLKALKPYEANDLADSAQIGPIVVSGGIASIAGVEDSTDLSLSLRVPNFEVTVLGGGEPAAGVSLSLNRDFNFLDFAMTDESGVAKFFIDDLDSQSVSAYAYIQSNPALSASFKNTEVEIGPGSIVTEGGIKKATINLATPNVRLTLAKETNPGFQTVPYGVVLLYVDNWFEFAVANENGEIALNVDVANIASKNPHLSGSVKLNVSVQAPYGVSGISGWDCQSGDALPICSDLPDVTIGTSYTAITIEDPVMFLPSNTFVTVLDPAGNAVGAGAWVSLMKDSQIPGCDTCRDWVGGSITDANGVASFTLTDTTSATVSYSVEVFPTWETRQQFASKTHFAATFDDVNNKSFQLAMPNLKLNVKEPSAAASQWGYVIVEKVRSDDSLSFLSGAGMDNQGAVTLSLPNSSTISLTVFPGAASSAVPTTCEVVVDSAGIVTMSAGKCSAGSNPVGSSLDLTLSAGNVTGELFFSTSETLITISGALIVAKNAAGNTVTATSDSNGRFGLQLPANVGDTDSWSFDVFYVKKAGDPEALPDFKKFPNITITDPSAPASQGRLNLAT